MFFFTFKWIIISLLLIALIHYLYYFLIDMLTVPKVRDLIHKPREQYEELFKHTLNKSAVVKDTLDINDDSDMSTELKKYVEDLKNNT